MMMGTLLATDIYSEKHGNFEGTAEVVEVTEKGTVFDVSRKGKRTKVRVLFPKTAAQHNPSPDCLGDYLARSYNEHTSV